MDAAQAVNASVSTADMSLSTVTALPGMSDDKSVVFEQMYLYNGTQQHLAVFIRLTDDIALVLLVERAAGAKDRVEIVRCWLGERLYV